MFLYQTSGSKQRLLPMLRNDRDPAQGTGTPRFYYVSGLNVSGQNSFTIGLNPIPDTSGSSDLTIYIRQMPLTMVSGGQAPEIPVAFQDYLPYYAAWAAYIRRGRDWAGMADRMWAEWERGLKKAERYVNPLMRDVPVQIYDNAGYSSWWE